MFLNALKSLSGNAAVLIFLRQCTIVNLNQVLLIETCTFIIAK